MIANRRAQENAAVAGGGLSHVGPILLLAAGRTWMESVPGDGAIVQVWLPREPAAGLTG